MAGDPVPRTWSVAIFASRENSATLCSAVQAAVVAAAGVPACVDVLVNGNEQLALETAERLPRLRLEPGGSTAIRVWHIIVADKAHAWNEYLHELWPDSEVAFFVDGYAQVRPDAFALLSEGLTNNPNVLAASGVPSMGRSARLMRRSAQQGAAGHGNLHALRGEVCRQLRERGFRLPLGVYWTDGIVLGVVCFGLDPVRNEWDQSRILAHLQATWWFRPLAWWRLRDLWAHGKRMMRQARGRLENLAIREHLHLQRNPAESLPRTASELVQRWLEASPSRARRIFLRQPLCFFAARNLRRPRDWSQTALPPRLLARRDSAGSEQESLCSSSANLPVTNC
ncbi:MAG TPA: hypothetical protein VFK81_16550 [Terriglobales bacterium]|nr:hypothetical protein [Terriglobales bacterium]